MNCFCDGRFCKMPNKLPVWNGLQMELWQCINCRHVTVHPIPHYTDLWTYYRTEYKYPDRGHLDNLIVSDVLKMVESNKLKWIHDYGCGDGYHISRLKEANSSLVLTGFDPDENMIKKAEGRGLHAVWSRGVCANADLVMMNHCLEHSNHPVLTLMHARNSMASHGRMMIRVPNASFGHTMEDFTKWRWFGIPWHLNYFTPRSLGAALAAVGMTVTDISCSRYREQAPPEMLDELMKTNSAEELVALASDAR